MTQGTLYWQYVRSCQIHLQGLNTMLSNGCRTAHKVKLGHTVPSILEVSLVCRSVVVESTGIWSSHGICSGLTPDGWERRDKTCINFAHPEHICIVQHGWKPPTAATKNSSSFILTWISASAAFLLKDDSPNPWFMFEPDVCLWYENTALEMNDCINFKYAKWKDFVLGFSRPLSYAPEKILSAHSPLFHLRKMFSMTKHKQFKYIWK